MSRKHCHKPSSHKNRLVPTHKSNTVPKTQYAKESSTSPALINQVRNSPRKLWQIHPHWMHRRQYAIGTHQCHIVQSANPTSNTMAQTQQLLDYLAAQQETVFTYWRCDMKLAVHSNTSYLRWAFLLIIWWKIILNIAHIIKHIMSSTTKAKLAALYIMACKAVCIHIILDEMGHKQLPTPIQTDNTMANTIINGKVQLNRTKAMDIHFHLLHDCKCQQQFTFFGDKTKNNSDYWTKHH